MNNFEHIHCECNLVEHDIRFCMKHIDKGEIYVDVYLNPISISHRLRNAFYYVVNQSRYYSFWDVTLISDDEVDLLKNILYSISSMKKTDTITEIFSSKNVFDLVCITFDNGSNQLYTGVVMRPHKNILIRCWRAYKYIFNYRTSYGSYYDQFVITPAGARYLLDFIEKYETQT